MVSVCGFCAVFCTMFCGVFELSFKNFERSSKGVLKENALVLKRFWKGFYCAFGCGLTLRHWPALQGQLIPLRS